MTRLSIPRRIGAVALFTLATSLLSCGREITGPVRGQPATVAFAPRFATAVTTVGETVHSVASLVPFERVRIVLRRAGEVVADRFVNFPTGVDTVALSIPVTLTGEGGSQGETFEATLRYINAQGDTVFSGGPITVFATPGTSPGTPAEIEVTHVGPGANAVSVQIAPDSVVANSGTSTTFTATAFDAQASPVSNAVIGFISRDPSIVSVPNLGSGAVQLVGVRGTTYVLAQLIDGAVDSAKVTVNPVPSQLAIVSGNAQQTLASTEFSQALRVRVIAADGLGVAGWPVAFEVASGGGTLALPSAGGLSSIVTEVLTDGSGFAEVIWTAGATAGAGSVTASITGPTGTVTFSGTQLSADPALIEFGSAVLDIAAGQSFNNLNVIVKNGAGQVATNFDGPVAIKLNGGTAGAQLLGIDTVNATAGEATFSEFTVDRAGTGYFFTAQAVGFPAVGTSNTFSVAPAPAELITLVSGDGQSAPANFPLADSIRVRVTDQFGIGVVGITVTFTVAAGGGAAIPATAVTDADGRAATQWLLGSAGVQSLEVSAEALESLVVGATVVGGVEGPPQLFAGFDYTFVPAGRTVLIPIYLSSPSVDPITVSLTSDDTLATWSSSFVVIPAGTTRLDVPITGIVPSSSWAFMSSTAGNDSVLVTVDSAWVSFVPLDFTEFLLGDTVQTAVRLSDPAPAGGVLVTVRSLDPALVRVAPSSGKGTPVPGCVSPEFCFLSRAPEAVPVTEGAPQILAPFADSAQILIPEGQLWAKVAVEIIGDGGGFASTELQVEAAAHTSGNYFIDVIRPTVTPYNSLGTLAAPLGIGQTFGLQFQLSNGAATREREITVVSRTPSVVSVEPTARLLLLETLSNRVRVEALTVGSSWVVYSSPGMDSDSTLITVTTPAIDINPGAVNSTPNATSALVMRLGTPGGAEFRERASNLPFTVRVTDPAVVAVDQSGGVFPAGATQLILPYRYVGVGSSWIVLEAANHAPDSVLVSATATGFAMPFTPTVGVGLTTTAQIFVGLLGSPVTTTTVTVTSLSPALVRVLTPQLELSRNSSTVFVKLEGLGEGTALIRVSGGPYTTTDFEVNVVAGTMTFTGFTTLLLPDPSLSVPVAGLTVAGSFNVMPPADTVFAVLRSSNASIVLVTDSLLRFDPGSAVSFDDGTIQPVGPGVAQLTLHAPQLTTSAPLNVTVEPLRLSVTTQSSVVGTRLAVAATIRRNSPTAAPLAVSLAKTGTGDVSVLQGSIVIPADSDAVTVDIVGEAVGAMSLIFSAAGLASDTIPMTVDSSALGVSATVLTPQVGYLDSDVMPLIRVGESSVPSRPGVPMRFVLTSSDTTKIRVLQDTVEFAAGDGVPTRVASVRYLQPGDASLTFASLDGFYTDATRVFTITPAELTGNTSYASDAIVLGMNQEAYFGEIYVDRGFSSDESMWVFLTSSVPGLVTIPDSVLISAGSEEAIISLAAGDSIGSARITAWAPGWNPWEFDVFVTRTMAQPNFDNGFTGGRMGGDLYIMDMISYYARPAATSLPLKLTVEDPTFAVFDVDTLTFPAGEASVAILGPRGLRGGTGRAYVSDGRTGRFDLIARGGDEISLSQPSLAFSWPRYQATPGLRAFGSSHSLGMSNGQDTTVLRFSSLGGRVLAEPDSLLVERFTFSFIPSTISASFSLTGVSAGVDTLIVESDGFISDSAVVSIEPGILRASTLQAQTILLSDSVRVTLQLQDAAGEFAETTTSQLLSFSTDTTLVVTDGSTVVSTSTVPIGATQAEFWVKGLTLGSSELVVSGTNFRTLRLVFTVRAPE